jgi:ribosomal-protein-alanine N-acetyltransferase
MILIEPSILETERLRLRLLTPDIYNAVFQSYSDEELKVFFGFSTDQELLLEKQKHRAGLTNYKISFRLFHLIEKTSGDVIGACGFHTWYVHHYRAEIGYSIYSDNRKGKGYMKEAIKPIIEYGFNVMELN